MNLQKIVAVNVTMMLIVINGLSQSSTRSHGLGDTGLGFTDINAIYQNPSGYKADNKYAIHLDVIRPFGIKELKSAQIAMAYRGSEADFFFGTVSSKGFSKFRQSQISIGYGRKLFNSLSIAMEFASLMLVIPEYGDKIVFGYGVSAQLRPYKEIIVGVRLQNPLPIYNLTEFRPHSLFAVGVTYSPSDLVSIAVEMYKDTMYRPRIKCGLEYQVATNIILRFGVTTAPSQIHFGAGWKTKKKLSIESSVAYHSLLGITPSVGVGYEINAP